LNTIQIIFRCEFGNKYGFGHLMRSVALAQAFFEYEQVETFCFSASNSDGYNELFNSANMTHVQLPESAVGLSFDPNNHLKLTNKFITIFDNYDVTGKQMVTYKQNLPNLVAIDDLADRVFNVDMIINQNLGSDQLNYNFTTLPKLFLGEKYALLRENILSARRKKENKHIFMSFGGGEVYERIKKLLDIMLRIDKELNEKITIDFILSGKKENKKQIRKLLTMFKRLKFNLVENQMDLSPYLARADFAVTAAGSTVFELAYLGVPQIVFVIDKNQEISGQKINEMGLGICLGNIYDVDKDIFSNTFNSFLYDGNMKQNISKQSQSIIDGRGAQRVADGILKHYGYA